MGKKDECAGCIGFSDDHTCEGYEDFQRKKADMLDTVPRSQLTAARVEIELYRSYLQIMADMSEELAFNANGEWFCRVARKALDRVPLPTKGNDRPNPAFKHMGIDEQKFREATAPASDKDCGHAPHLWVDEKTCRCGKSTSEIVPEKDNG